MDAKNFKGAARRFFRLCIICAPFSAAAIANGGYESLSNDWLHGADSFYYQDPVISDTEFIQQIVDAASDGEECVIPSGAYTVEGVALCRPIHLRGNGKVTLRPDSSQRDSSQSSASSLADRDFIFAIWSDDVTIEGFTFDTADDPFAVSIAHYSGSRPAIRGNTFVGGSESLCLIHSAAADHSTIENNHFTTLSEIPSVALIHLDGGGAEPVIRNNTFNGQAYASAEAVLASASLSDSPLSDSEKSVFVPLPKRSSEALFKYNPMTGDAGISGWFLLPLLVAQGLLIWKWRSAKRRKNFGRMGKII
jgi:hypothetical protein